MTSKSAIFRYGSAAAIALYLSIRASQTYADIVYTTIELSCNREQNVALISVLYTGHDGDNEVDLQRDKSTYSLGPREGKVTRKSGFCELAEDTKIGFVGIQMSLPKDDTLSLLLDGQSVGTFPLGYGEWTMKIHKRSSTVYAVQYCGPERGLPVNPCLSYLFENGHRVSGASLRK
jgi:hypothetical protein